MLNPMELFEVAPAIRYVALYVGGELVSAQRPGIVGASASESDRYEELLVNPTLLRLVTQRGNIDCGGARYVLVRYGHFFELVIPLGDGHLSVGLEPDALALPLVDAVLDWAASRVG